MAEQVDARVGVPVDGRFGAAVPALEDRGNGVWDAPGARIIDRTGRKMLPIGDDGFANVVESAVVVDKTMLIADVLDAGYKVTLFCRPRRFGKTFNMRMLQAFFELPTTTGSNVRDRASLFEGMRIWEADGGFYRQFQGVYPVVYLNLNTVKKATWPESLDSLRAIIAAEYARHGCLVDSSALNVVQARLYDRVVSGIATEADLAHSLEALCQMLYAHHGTPVMLFIDEYDAPVMAGYSAPNGGYYREVVDFLKGWLTGALKGGDAFLARACLTGVQRISKESIFSDLNNMGVSTALSIDSDERFGFTDAEVVALATYLGRPGCIDEARAWYDGYRFGNVDAYNPWSLLNYFKQGCKPRDYWGNTSGNAVLGDLVRRADADTLANLYRLCEPGGVVWAPLDLGVVFPDAPGSVPSAVWSMLYLAGYVTTDEPEHDGDALLDPYPLRIPNREIAVLYKREIVARFAEAAGGADRYYGIHAAVVGGDDQTLEELLRAVVRSSTSSYDLVSENAAHMLLLGLLYGVRGYETPESNLERGAGRFDLRLVPSGGRLLTFSAGAGTPLVTIEVKHLARRDVPQDPVELAERLCSLADEALRQIDARGYDRGPLPAHADGRLRWGIAFGGKDVAVKSLRP